METEKLKEYKGRIENLSEEDKIKRDMYLKEMAEGKIFGPMTGYASIDKPWLKYYTKEELFAPIIKGNIYEAIHLNKDKMLNNPALQYAGINITYKDFLTKIDEVADALVSMGVKENDFIVSTLPGTPESIYLIYAAAKIGACIDLIDPLVNPNLLAKYCAKTKPKLMFCLDAPNIANSSLSILHKGAYDKIIMVHPINALHDFAHVPIEETKYNDEDIVNWSDFMARRDQKASMCSYKENRPLAVLHTGGTTGVPKGALLTHDNLNALATQMINSPIDLTLGETALNLMPPFAAYGLCNGIHTHLVAGLTLILIPEYEPSKIASQLIEYKPNRIACSPAHFEYIRDSKELKNMDLSFLRSPIVGGDSINIKLEQDLNDLFLSHGSLTKVAKAYGLSETAAAVSACVNNEVNKMGAVGIPLTKTIIGIFNFDNENEEYTYGQKGEVAILSPNNMACYYDMPLETNKMLKKHADGTIWLHTGDIGYMDNDGVLFISGRLRRMIIQYCGLKANPFEAEVELLKHPLVKNVAVVGAKDPDHEQGSIPVAFVEIDKDTDTESLQKDLIALCDEHVTYYSIPMDYIYTENLPKTSRGKIDIIELENNYNKMSLTRKLIPHRSLDIN